MYEAFVIMLCLTMVAVGVVMLAAGLCGPPDSGADGSRKVEGGRGGGRPARRGARDGEEQGPKRLSDRVG